MTRDRKGSATVFLAILLSGMAYLMSVFISQARDKAIEGAVDSLGGMWASSLLGEYDIKLWQEYGIFAFCGTEVEEAEKLDILSDYSFDEKGYIDVTDLQVDFIGYDLMLMENFRTQIRNEGIAMTLKGEDIFMPDYEAATDAEEGSGMEGRTIVNERIIKSLPSYGRVDDGILDRIIDILEELKDPKELIRAGTDSFLINKYIDSKFSDLVENSKYNNHYFICEKEYILSGKFSDEANRKSVRNRIILIREGMNLLFLEQDPEMSAAALALGEVITGGMGGPAAQQAVMAAWALAESINDYKLLIHGKKVPFMKTKESWAIDIETIAGNKETGYVDSGSETGNSYQDYLDVLLYALGEDARLLRIMDLIEINMKYGYNEDFSLEDCYVGLRITMEVNGKTYRWNDEYMA